MEELRILRAMLDNPGWHSGKELAALSKVDIRKMHDCLGHLAEAGLIEDRQGPLEFGGHRLMYRACVMRRLSNVSNT